MNAPETGAHLTHATDAGLHPDPPGRTRLRQLADQQAALRRVATLVAREARPAEVFAAVADPLRGSGLTGLKDRIEALGGTFSRHSPKGGGTAVSCELPVPAQGGRPDAGHVE